jgi:hypothetical protein
MCSKVFASAGPTDLATRGWVAEVVDGCEVAVLKLEFCDLVALSAEVKSKSLSPAVPFI